VSKTGETIRAISHNKTESISKVSELSPPGSSGIDIYAQTLSCILSIRTSAVSDALSHMKPEHAGKSGFVSLPTLQHCLFCTRASLSWLRYEPEVRGFDSRCGYWDFFLLIPSGSNMVAGSKQPQTNEYLGYILGTKDCRCMGLTSSLLSCAY
jgi:hypothetical protein